MSAKEPRTLVTPGSRRIIAITNAPSTGTQLAAKTHVIAAPSADATWSLVSPKRGSEVTVIVDTSSTKVVTLRTNSSAQTFFGSTTDSLALTTGQGCVKAKFIGVSTSQWAPVITSKSTAALGTFSASTR